MSRRHLINSSNAFVNKGFTVAVLWSCVRLWHPFCVYFTFQRQYTAVQKNACTSEITKVVTQGKLFQRCTQSFVLQCTKRTLHASVLVYKFCPEKTGFNVYAEYTQLQLTFLALHNYLYIIIRCLQVCHFLCLLPIFNLWGGSTPPTPLVTAKKIRLNFFWNFDTKKSCGKSP